MPIKTRIDVGADSEQFKRSFATFQKYQAALKEQYGAYVMQAPYVKAAADAGGQVANFLDLDKAARSQTLFAASAQKASLSFRGLASGVKQTLEGFARVALSPLELLFPAGLAVGLFGLGAGLVGAGTFFGLERGAAGVSDRRRDAMGLGVSYGSLSAYELNFSRFGVGEGTLGAVASGVYDVTSPEYLGLLSSGATGHGDTSEAAIDLIRNIPKILHGVPDEMVGPVARSHNLTDLLDLPTIIRLRSHPEEIEAQIKRYREDRKTLDISKEAQQKWASFNAAIERAGQTIESALGRNLVSLTGPLKSVSESIVNIISAALDSGTVTDALKGIESGLREFTGFIGSSAFREDAKSFLRAIEAMEPYAQAIAKMAATIGRLGVAGYKLFADPNYNPSATGLVGDVTGIRRARAHPSEPAVGHTYTTRRQSDITPVRGARRSKYQPAIDSATGKPESPEFKYSPKLGHGWNASVGDIPPALLAQVQAANPQLTPRQCVELVQSTMGVGNVHDWRRGPSEKDSPEGAALATFGFHGDSSLYAYGGSGTPGIGRDHALKMVRKYPDGSFDAISQDIGHAPHLIHMPYTGTGGEGDASSYFAVFDKNGRPAGGNAELFDKLHTGDLPSVGHPHSTGRMSIGAPMDLPGSTPPRAVGESLHYDNDVGLRNPALRQRGRALHILDHMDLGPPPGPITIDNQTGGSVQVTVSRHMATQ